MGLDCWVYASDGPVQYEEVEANTDDGEEYSYTSQSLADGYSEIWYGRKTHTIMDYLLREAHYEDSNCNYISLSHLDLDELKIDFTRELITSEQIEEHELDRFKELIDALSEVPEDKYLYFYAWY